MDELISRCAMLEYLESIHDDSEWLVSQYNADWIYSWLESQPTVDAVPVVRCKDCKYYEIHKPKILENCERNGQLIPMMPNDFCSYGERKENETN